MRIVESHTDRTPSPRAAGASRALVAVGVFLLALLPAPARAAEPFDQNHSRYARVLAAVVKDARVDYAKLKANPAELDAYLKEIAAVPGVEFSKWSETNRLALLINLYNAQTLRLIVNHYPLRSIRSIGLLPGAAWREPNVRFGGQIVTLDQLEHKIIRVEYRDPRIHFALVCAAIGCPPLRSEPYVGARLGEQLDNQLRRFLAEPEKNRYEATKNTLHLSPIFKWYADEFTESAGSLALYVRPYLPEAQRGVLTDPARVKVRFTDYNWALNVQPKP